MSHEETTDSLPPMTVLALTVDSYQRIGAMHVTPTATGLVPVRGRNGQGKSSAIGALAEALGAHKSELPIKEGEHGAEIVVDLGALKVLKTFTRDSGGKAKPKLVITGAYGAQIKSPAAVLKELRSHFADPVAFLSMDAREQVKTVLKILGMDVDLERLEAEAEGHYHRRRDLGRDADRMGKAALEVENEIGGYPVPMPVGTLEAAVAELEAAKDHNAKRGESIAARGAAEMFGRDAADRVESLRAQLEKAELEIAKHRVAWEDANGTCEKVGEEVATLPIVERIRACEESARHDGRRELAVTMRSQADAAKAEHKEASDALDSARNQIEILLRNADFPVDGMAYDSGAKTLTINDIPFSNASQAERLKASAAVAMAGDPKIRVMFAREGSLLDEESRVQLATLAEERGWQLFLEMVDSQAEGAGIYIEDGEAFENGEQS